MPAKRTEKRDVMDHAQKVDDIFDPGNPLPQLKKRKPEKMQSLTLQICVLSQMC